MPTNAVAGGLVVCCLIYCALLCLQPLAAQEPARAIQPLGGQMQPDEESADDAQWPYTSLSEPTEDEETWFDNLSFFGGLDGSKQPQDFGVNANLGGRFAASVGLPLWREADIGFQIGTATVGSSNAVQVFERVSGNKGRFQSFTTLGVFQRLDNGLRWGFGYDFLAENYYDLFTLGQWRMQVGYLLNGQNEVGLWSALRNRSDSGFFGAIPVTVRPLNVGNLYWRHTWASFAQTTVWAGISEGHGEVNLALGDLPRTQARFIYGAEVHVPLNDNLAIFGQTNLITPADSGTVDAFLGLEYYPARGAWLARERKFAPLLSVAGSPTFSVDLLR